MWSFLDQGVIPGALLMPQCVAASSRTIPPGSHVHNVQTQFIRIGTVTKPVTYRVENLNDGKTFATRQVKVEQDGKTIALTTVGFTKRTSVAGRGTAFVEHATPVAMSIEAPREEYDVIKYMRRDRDPTVKGYALPIVTKGVCVKQDHSPQNPPNLCRSFPSPRIKTRTPLAPRRGAYLN